MYSCFFHGEFLNFFSIEFVGKIGQPAFHAGHFFDGLLRELRHFQEVQFHVVVEPSLGTYVIDAVHGVHGFFGKEGVAEYADRIELTSMDAVALIKSIKKPRENTFCYLDPPYYVRGRDLYLNYYTDDDHRAIAKAIKKYKGKWIVSYDAVDFIKELYKDNRQQEYYLSYSAGNPAKGKEIMVYSEGLVIPEVEIVKKNK